MLMSQDSKYGLGMNVRVELKLFVIMAEREYDVFSDYLELHNIVKPKVTKLSQVKITADLNVKTSKESTCFKEFNPLQFEQEQKLNGQMWRLELKTKTWSPSWDSLAMRQTQSDLTSPLSHQKIWDSLTTRHPQLDLSPPPGHRKLTNRSLQAIEQKEDLDISSQPTLQTKNTVKPQTIDLIPTCTSPQDRVQMENLCRLPKDGSTLDKSPHVPSTAIIGVTYYALEQGLCNFCRTNGETPQFFKSHTLKDRAGKVVCPVLRSFRCPICNSTGDNAHTVTYCPFGRGNASTMTAARTTRKGCGCIREKDNKSCRHHQK